VRVLRDQRGTNLLKIWSNYRIWSTRVNAGLGPASLCGYNNDVFDDAAFTDSFRGGLT